MWGGHFSQLPPVLLQAWRPSSGLWCGLRAQGSSLSLLKQVLSHTAPYTLWLENSMRSFFFLLSLLLLGSDYFHLASAARVESLKHTTQQKPTLQATCTKSRRLLRFSPACAQMATRASGGGGRLRTPGTCARCPREEGPRGPSPRVPSLASPASAPAPREAGALGTATQASPRGGKWEVGRAGGFQRLKTEQPLPLSSGAHLT